MQIRGVWIIELAELDSMSRPEIGRVKSFLSRNVDRFRPPYGRRLVEVPRQCIFAGTTNRTVYLRDETGGRRFWPVRCGNIDVEALERDRDQLWAEARHEFETGAAWWLDSAELTREAEQEQRDRYEEEDVWDEKISDFTAPLKDTRIAEILKLCIKKPEDSWTQADKNRIAKWLLSHGWERYNAGTRIARQWRYRRGKHPS